MGELTPIVAGALYRDVSSADGHGDTIRVKSVWVDEDTSVNVQVFTERGHIENLRSRTIDIETFIDKIDDEIIRINTDHEAWKWRN
jgi:hypothetical protein